MTKITYEKDEDGNMIKVTKHQGATTREYVTQESYETREDLRGCFTGLVFIVVIIWCIYTFHIA